VFEIYFVRTRALATAASLFVCFAAGFAPALWAQEQPIAPETNPPGDIPDSQVFIDYESAMGFVLKVPEGWARSDRADGAHFADKYDGVDISVALASTAPTTDSAVKNEVAALIKSGRAVKVSATKSISLPAGQAVLIVYASNSEPNEVTNKQIRLDNNRYLVYRTERIATLTLSAPAGADNADQWRLMAESFRWR